MACAAPNKDVWLANGSACLEKGSERSMVEVGSIVNSRKKSNFFGLHDAEKLKVFSLPLTCTNPCITRLRFQHHVSINNKLLEVLQNITNGLHGCFICNNWSCIIIYWRTTNAYLPYKRRNV